jgi:hypothetical protein
MHSHCLESAEEMQAFKLPIISELVGMEVGE